MEETKSSRDRLIDEFSGLLTDAQDTMKRAAQETGERARDLQSQAEAKMQAAWSRLEALRGEAVQRAKAAAHVTDEYVHDNPWRAIGAAAIVGFVVGMCLPRR